MVKPRRYDDTGNKRWSRSTYRNSDGIDGDGVPREARSEEQRRKRPRKDIQLPHDIRGHRVGFLFGHKYAVFFDQEVETYNTRLLYQVLWARVIPREVCEVRVQEWISQTSYGKMVQIQQETFEGR